MAHVVWRSLGKTADAFAADDLPSAENQPKGHAPLHEGAVLPMSEVLKMTARGWEPSKPPEHGGRGHTPVPSQ